MPPIPLTAIYAILGGTVLALIIATAANKWQPRVFFLLALRLAIGWHFCFEGLHKIHSHEVGKTEYNRPFSSDPYFSAAEGPLGPWMRKEFLEDTDKVIQERIAPQEDKVKGFASLSLEEQAKLCPAPIADLFSKIAKDETLQAKVAKQLADAKEATTKAEAAAKDEKDPKKQEDLKKKVTEAKAKQRTEEERVRALAEDGLALKFSYARWMYGVDTRDAKVKHSESDVPQTVPDRVGHIRLMTLQVRELEARDAEKLGNGYGVELKKAAAARTDLQRAKADLVKDADSFAAELIKFTGAEAPKPEPRKIEKLDKQTMWMITIVGACLLLGLFTPLACVIGAGFLVMTYLAHPPFPWLPQPPNTEGNPLFVNKNVIELLALLAIAVHPTGRWLGLDALWTWGLNRIVKGKAPAPTAKATS